MSGIRNRQTGEDLGNALSSHLVAAQTCAMAIAPSADKLLAKEEFGKFVLAMQAATDAWAAYLEADLRATIAGGEHLEALERAQGSARRLVS